MAIDQLPHGRIEDDAGPRLVPGQTARHDNHLRHRQGHSPHAVRYSLPQVVPQPISQQVSHSHRHVPINPPPQTDAVLTHTRRHRRWSLSIIRFGLGLTFIVVIVNGLLHYHYTHRSLAPLPTVSCPDTRLSASQCHAPMALIRCVNHIQNARNWTSTTDTGLALVAASSNGRFPYQPSIAQRLDDQMRWAGHVHANATMLIHEHAKFQQTLTSIMASTQRQLSPTYWDLFPQLEQLYTNTFGLIYPSTYSPDLPPSHILATTAHKILTLYSSFVHHPAWHTLAHALVTLQTALRNSENSAYNAWADPNLLPPELCAKLAGEDIVCSVFTLASVHQKRDEWPAIVRFLRETVLLRDGVAEDEGVVGKYRGLQAGALERLKVVIERDLVRVARGDLYEDGDDVPRVFSFDGEDGVSALGVLHRLGKWTRTAVEEGAQMAKGEDVWARIQGV